MWKTWTEAFGEDEQLVEMCSPFFVSLEELAMFPGYTDLVALPLVSIVYWIIFLLICIRTLKLSIVV